MSVTDPDPEPSKAPADSEPSDSEPSDLRTAAEVTEISELYFEFVETVMSGRRPDVEEYVAGREELRAEIEEAYRMALE